MNENISPTKTLREALDTNPSERPVDFQMQYLGIQNMKLIGASVCEVGTGRHEALAKELQAKVGPMGHITLISPHYAGAVDTQGKLLIESEPDPTPTRRLAGKIEDVELVPDAYDLIVGSFSVPLHLDKTKLDVFLNKILSALKPGGRACFYPVQPDTLSKYPAFKNFLGDHTTHRASCAKLEAYWGTRKDTSLFQTLVIEKK